MYGKHFLTVILPDFKHQRCQPVEFRIFPNSPTMRVLHAGVVKGRFENGLL